MLITRIIDALKRVVRRFRGRKQPESSAFPVEKDPLPASVSGDRDEEATRSVLVESGNEIPDPPSSPQNIGRQSPPIQNEGHSERASEQPAQDAKHPLRKKPRSVREPREIKARRRTRAPKRTSNMKEPLFARPELLCRKVPGTHRWEVVLSGDEDCLLSTVHLEGTQLESTDQECLVPSLTGQLTVSCQDGRECNMPLFEGEALVFKLRKNWAGVGRKATVITAGYFIVIAPDNWSRTGHVPVEPDSCTDPAFQAHYFFRGKTTTDEDVGGFRECDVLPNASGIELHGEQVFDDCEEGALFVGDAPVLKSSPGVAWARVGEEAKQGWKGQNFRPVEQTLPDVIKGREGHFFLRVYDSQTRLLDSTEFRYLRNLAHIRVNGAPYSQDTVFVPGLSGYPPTEVRFLGVDNTLLSPILRSEAKQSVSHSGVIEFPRQAAADHMSCILQGSNASGVGIVLQLPRIWWRMNDDSDDSHDWQDTPLVMTRRAFQNHARKGVEMSVLSKQLRSVQAGFDNELDRPYSRTTEEDRILIPLAHFADYKQIGQRLAEDAYFKVKWAGEIVTLIRISADLKPQIDAFYCADPKPIYAGQEVTLRWTTRNAGMARARIDPGVGVVEPTGTCTVSPAATTRFTLTLSTSSANHTKSSITVSVLPQPYVDPDEGPIARVWAAGGGWRKARGFSIAEVREAGLSVSEASRRSIPVDRHRRTKHLINVESVRRLLDARNHRHT